MVYINKSIMQTCLNTYFYNILIFILLGWVYLPAQSQNLSSKDTYPIIKNLDSLHEVISHTNDKRQRLYQLFLFEVNAFRLFPSRFGEHFEEFKSLSVRLHNNEGLAIYYRWKSIKYQQQGLFNKASDVLQQSLKICKEHKDTINTLRALSALIKLHNSGLVEGSVNNAAIALQLADEGIKLAHESNSFYDKYNLMALKGGALKSQAKYQEAEKVFLQAIEIVKPLKDYERFRIEALSNLISVMIMQKKYLKAYSILKKIYPLSLSSQNNNQTLVILFNMSYCCRELKRFDECEKYLLDGFDIASKNGENPIRLDFYNGFKQLYEAKKEFGKALLFAGKYQALKDSLFTSEKVKQIGELQIKYDTEKKDAQLAEQKLEIVQKQQRITQIALIATVFVLALIGFFALYRWYQQRKIKQLESTFEQTTQQLQSFNYSVSHDLRHPLISTQYALDKLKNTPLSSEQVIQIQKAEGSLKNMNEVIEAMLTLSAIERDALNIKVVDLKELIMDVLEGFSTQADIQLKGLPTVRADIRQLRQVMVNLLSNAIKYTAHQPEPKIQITGHEDKGTIWVEVEDNGLGFDEHFSAKLFQLFGRLHPDVNGVGVGLVIVKRIIEKHGGKVWAKGKQGQGAVFGFTLPK